MMLRLVLLLSSCLLLAACVEETTVSPKPRGFPRVLYPERGYQTFEESYCAFTFEYPVYAEIQRDTVYFEEESINDCWFDVYMPFFDARIHCTYFPITGNATFENLRSDAFKFANKHNVKASYIDEFPISKPDGTRGFLFNIEGPAASPFQFYLSDSTDHFLRGALYFNTDARPDSLAPVFDFVKEDVLHLINTLDWSSAP
jgi:gliding motility-associated lipoprotein GldD